MEERPTYDELRAYIEVLEKKLADRDSQRQSYEKLFDLSLDMLCVASLDGYFTYVNDAFERTLGYSKAELTAQPFFSFVHPDHQEATAEALESLTTGAPLADFENLYRCKDGSHKWLAWTAMPAPDEGAAYAAARDITNRKRLEEEKSALLEGLETQVRERTAELVEKNEALQKGIESLARAEKDRKELESKLIQSQRMEAIGALAGGISHEFNNSLMGLSGSVELLEMDAPDDASSIKCVDNIKRSIERMSGLTGKLLAYAQGGKYQPRPLSLNDMIERELPIITYGFSNEVGIELNLGDGLPDIEADATQMTMVLSAILTNSSEAIEGKGRIRIRTRSRDFDQQEAGTYGLNPGVHIGLTIEDDGKGMDREIRERIFEPFSTTKFHGSGLGMASVHGIVMSHEGYVAVSSEVGRGTSVTVYLPAAKRQKEEGEQMSGSELTQNVLVIEDEEIVMEVTSELLKRLGYSVLPAATGKEAIDIANRYDGAIAYALLDIKLTDMGGDAVYPHLRASRPDTKVYVCSGFSLDGPAQKILDAGAEGFLQKPFTFKDLSERLGKAESAG